MEETAKNGGAETRFAAAYEKIIKNGGAEIRNLPPFMEKIAKNGGT